MRDQMLYRIGPFFLEHFSLTAIKYNFMDLNFNDPQC